jgi:hypothetical protein
MTEVKDGMQPVAKTPLALLLVQHYSIAESEFGIIWPCPTQQNNHIKQEGNFK